MSDTRTLFAAQFGDEQAEAIQSAAEGHKNGVHDRYGSDKFKWALTICIGHECFTNDSYRAEHGITAPVDEVKQWIKDEADLASHDGDFDFLAAMAGAYEEYLPERAS